jgi:F-type H+-transporting ATPase subunit b
VIDPFTVIAQIVNFLILVALLRYFLYQRVLDAMDDRQREIAARWEEAEQQRDSATAEVDAAKEKNRQLDDQREQLLAAMHDDVEQHRLELTAKVRTEVDELRERWSEAVREEMESFLHDLRRRVSEEACEVARRVLADLADVEFEVKIIKQFLDKINRLSDEERRPIIKSLQGAKRIAVVQTAFDLSDQQRRTIKEVLQRQFVTSADVQFECSQDMHCGVALRTNSHKLAWNVRDYLSTLEEDVRQSLEEEATRPRAGQTESATKP